MKTFVSSLFLMMIALVPRANAIFQSTPLPSLYCKSVHQASFEQTATQYEEWSKLRHYPENLAENSSAQLFDSVQAFTREFQPKIATMDLARFWKGRELFLNSKIPQKYRGLWVLHATVEKALVNQDIPAEVAAEVGILAQKALAEAQDLNWTEYRTELNALLGYEAIPQTRAMQLDKTFQTLLNSVHVDKTYQIPYLAGYAKQDAHKIYIDRGVKPYYMTEDGHKLDVSLDLTIHEFVEKSLIDWTQLNQKLYLRNHQIAQRIEKAMVEYSGFSWAEYQGKIMQKEIIRADDDGRSDLTLKRVPIDLDLTPYIDYEEWDMIARMKRAAQP